MSFRDARESKESAFAIEVSNLTFDYGVATANKSVLRDVSFALPVGTYSESYAGKVSQRQLLAQSFQSYD